MKVIEILTAIVPLGITGLNVCLYIYFEAALISLSAFIYSEQLNVQHSKQYWTLALVFYKNSDPRGHV